MFLSNYDDVIWFSSYLLGFIDGCSIKVFEALVLTFIYYK